LFINALDPLSAWSSAVRVRNVRKVKNSIRAGCGKPLSYLYIIRAGAVREAIY
jgi:hypothetical protein